MSKLFNADYVQMKNNFARFYIKDKYKTFWYYIYVGYKETVLQTFTREEYRGC